MLKGFELLLGEGARRLGQLRGYREVARRVKEIALDMLGPVEVYVFGSAVTGRFTASSDIDLLIVTPGETDREKATKFKAKVHGLVDAPLELHVASQREYREWYSRFIEKAEKVD